MFRFSDLFCLTDTFFSVWMMRFVWVWYILLKQSASDNVSSESDTFCFNCTFCLSLLHFFCWNLVLSESITFFFCSSDLFRLSLTRFVPVIRFVWVWRVLSESEIFCLTDTLCSVICFVWVGYVLSVSNRFCLSLLHFVWVMFCLSRFHFVCLGDMFDLSVISFVCFGVCLIHFCLVFQFEIFRLLIHLSEFVS